MVGLRGIDDPVIRRNFVANVFDGSLFAFAISFVSLQAVLPVLVLSMGGSNVAVGLLPVIWTFGSNFPQMLMVSFARRIPFKKPLFMKTALLQRLPWLMLALFCFFALDSIDAGVRLVVFFVLFLGTATGNSINFPLWFDLVTKVTPVRIRGRMFAMRSIIGALLGVLGGSAVTYVLGFAPYPDNYGILFLLAFLVMMMSYGFLWLVRETTASAVKVAGNRESFADAVHILKNDVNFRNFLIADALVISSSMAGAFYAVHAVQQFALSDAFAGLFTVVMMGTTILGSVAFGFVADQIGHKFNLLLSAGAMTLGTAIALLAGSIEIYMLTFALFAVTASVNMISRLSIVAEFCDDTQKSAYIAITNTATAPFILLGVAAGWVADMAGYVPVFLFAGLCAFTAFIWLLLKVKEPRHLPAFSVPERL